MSAFLNFFKPKTKKINSLLVTPPLFEPWSLYLAGPLLTGQLLQGGYNAKNLDLNIRFFRMVLSRNYIEKTIKILDSKQIPYDNYDVDFLLNNIEDAINTYSKVAHGEEAFNEAQSIMQSVLDFVTLPYSSLIKLLVNFQKFESSKNFEEVKELSFDSEHNIFISFFEEVVNELAESDIDFIGISVPFPDTIVPAFTFARLLKERANIHVAIGGTFIKKETVLKNPEIFDIFCDSVMIADGEESIVELAKHLENRQKINKVPGLIYKNNKNKVVVNPVKPIKSMNNIADLSLEGVGLKEYMAEIPSISLIISKGCYWGKCKFCD